ncbi:MAG: ATP-dependent helicase HepA [Methanosaeta sp. PtaB.Bin005]|nr:MAG: ATP-dependent helicase HepA [Methanosaeta sp. PtaB.Bin005]
MIMDHIDIKPNMILRGSLFSEPVQVITVIPMGDAIKLIGKGLNTGKLHDPILFSEQLAALETTPENEPFDGDAGNFRLGVEAMRLALAHEYDPYFTLSIARVDPLPHQLEAVYDYFLKLPRIRFLLADDPGAGKTIMAGLLIKELKIRGLIKRILIVSPANLTFQWQREMQDKFKEHFEVLRSDILRANYGSNPWQEKNQIVTSMPWVSIIEDAKESLLRSHWDLVIVDEAHKMSAYSQDHKTMAYQLGEALSDRTDHFLLMTATPHKGDPANFSLFLRLLDKDVYADIKSLEEAMRRHEAPFYLRRVKEAMVTFPDPDTGKVKSLFTRRLVRTIEFEIDSDEWDLYNSLAEYVQEQSIKAAEDDSARGRALGFTMAMLQRRFASSIYALRRSLERIRDKREKVLKDPEGYRQMQIFKKVPEDYDELPEEEQQKIFDDLESVVASIDPDALKEEIFQLDKLIDQARLLEQREVESKLQRLKEVLKEQGVFADPKMKLLLFTEHKDTLEYLAGDGKDGRPLGKLREWGLSVTQIHGGMKIGDRDTAGTRINAERIFKEDCQVMAATEAAGEGINLQFCWFMINYDIPWNPMRLEQRMGRIHRYGQEKDCLILNFVSIKTREGRVLQKLFQRIEQIEKDLDPQNTGKVFNVLGDVLPANQLERMLRDMYANITSEDAIKSRIIEEVDIDRFRRITEHTLEGLAKKELNLSAILSKSEEAKERRLVPEVIEDFFLKAAPLAGIALKETKQTPHIYRSSGKVPRSLWQIGEAHEGRYGKLGKEYKQIVFDKTLLARDSTAEWVTPGHPLFEAVRIYALQKVEEDLRKGAIFFDLYSKEPSRLDVYSAAVKDGRGNVIHRRIFVVQTDMAGTLAVRQPTIFLDLIPSTSEVKIPEGNGLPDRDQIEQSLFHIALVPFLEEINAQRTKEIETIERHMEISLNELIVRQNLILSELMEKRERGETAQPIAASIKSTDDRIDDLNERLERRRKELKQEHNLSISDIQHHGRAWVLPHPDRRSPGMVQMVQDEGVERIAVQAVIAYEEARGWKVESVEQDSRGFDLISRRPHPEDPQTAVEVRFIEVKGRAGVGEIALTSNEYRTAERLKNDYWLYVVFNCASKPEIHTVQDPASLGWKPLVKIEHYSLESKTILDMTR